MTQREFDAGAHIRLRLAVPAFPTAREAHEVDWSRRIDLPPGEYVVRDCGRSADDLCGEAYGGGHYYELEGPGRGWVRQNYLLAAQHSDWPWDLNYCLEPIAWSKAWDYYRGQRGERSEPRSSTRKVRSPGPDSNDEGSPEAGHPAIDSDGAPVQDAPSPPNARVDEYGMRVADPDDLLPDFDRLFEIQE